MNWLSPRRWFRFSLRSLLVIVTLTCVVTGWLIQDYQLVQARRAMWDEITGNSSVFAAGLIPPDPPQRVSWVRRLMGDVACPTMLYWYPEDDPNRAQLREARRLFPEAKFWRWLRDGETNELAHDMPVLDPDRGVGDWVVETSAGPRMVYRTPSK